MKRKLLFSLMVGIFLLKVPMITYANGQLPLSSEQSVIPGDVNQDSSVNVIDLATMRKYMVNPEKVDIAKIAADVNADAAIDVADLILMRRYIAGGYGVELQMGVEPGCNHSQMKEYAYKAATCVDEGNIHYWTCSDCGECFTDSEGLNIVASENLIIPATGHIVVIDPAVEPTEIQDGLTEGSHCRACGLVIVEQKVWKREVTYTVTFYDYDGETVLGTSRVAEGGNATLPSSPSKAGATFLGWKGNYIGVSKDEKVIAVYNDMQNVFILSSAEGVANDIVTIMLSLDGTVNTCGFDMAVHYSSSLELVAFDEDQDLDIIANPNAIENGVLLNFSGTKNVTRQRNVVEFKFKIKEGAVGVLPIEVTASSVKAVIGETIPDVEFLIINGVVNVK